MAAQVSLIHYNRGEDFCPLCSASLIWRNIGIRKYVPCDKKPVICIWDEESTLRVVYRGELISKVRILRENNIHLAHGKNIFYALEPHVFTCPERRRKNAQYSNRYGKAYR